MGDEIKSDVQEMNKSFGYEDTVESQEDEGTAEIEDQETETETETVDEETQDEEVETETDPKSEADADSESSTESDEEDKDKIIAELRKKLNEKESKEEPKTEDEPEDEPEETQEPKFDIQNFIGEDEDTEDIVRDPKRLNEVFNKVYQKAVLDTQKSLGEGVLRSIPDIVRNSVAMMDKLKTTSEKFYTENEDLTPFKRVVAAVFEEVASDNPDKQMEDLLPLVADESRKRLQLHKKATKETNKPPRLPVRKRRTTMVEDKPSTDPLLNELQEMNKTLGGN